MLSMNFISDGTKYRPLIILSLAYALFLGFIGCGGGGGGSSTANNPNLTALATARPENIYTLSYQEDVQREIDGLKAGRTVDNPLVILDPFGTNNLSLYVYFGSAEEGYVEYRINADIDGVATPEFSRQINYGSVTRQHEFRIIGLVPGVTNTITLTLFNASNIVVSTNTFPVNAPVLNMVSYEPDYPKKFIVTPYGTPSGGLFISSCQSAGNAAAWLKSTSLMIDNDGIIRGQITISSSNNPKIVFLNGKMIYASSINEMAVVNSLGKVEKLYSMAPYTLHHDFVIDENNILVLVDGAGRKEDQIFKIDMDTGIGAIHLDLRTYFPGYDFTKNSTDWFHSNSLSVMKEIDSTTSLLISSREMSAILKINDIYGTKTLRYLITDNQGIYSYGTRLDRVTSITGRVLIPNLGQHTITYAGPENPGDPGNGKYYIHFYNNNYRVNNSGIDWNAYLSPEVLSLTETKSMLELYLVDEGINRCTLLKSMDVTYSPIMSSSQIYDGNFVGGSAMVFRIHEFDSDGNLLLNISYDNDDVTNQPLFYRVFKYPI
jgi:arylsulfate sulfotransferase